MSFLDKEGKFRLKERSAIDKVKDKFDGDRRGCGRGECVVNGAADARGRRRRVVDGMKDTAEDMDKSRRCLRDRQGQGGDLVDDAKESSVTPPSPCRIAAGDATTPPATQWTRRRTPPTPPTAD